MLTWQMPELETRQLRALAAIADAGTLTAAAARLGVTQPALSHTVRTIEQRLGASLFARDRKGMTPTEAGERLVRTARQVLGELDAVEEAITRQTLGRGELIRLSTQCYTAYHWLPAVLRDFREALPTVELRIVPAAVGRPLQALREREIDVAIVARRDRDEAFAYHRLFEDELVAVLPPDHPLSGRPHLTAADFCGGAPAALHGGSGRQHGRARAAPARRSGAGGDLLRSGHRSADRAGEGGCGGERLRAVGRRDRA